MSFPSYPSYKDSDIEWLGKVPANWDVSKLKTVIEKIDSGVSVNATDLPADSNSIGVLKTSCVYDGTFRCGENKTVVPEELDRVACPVEANTLIVSRMNTPALVGAAGLVRKSRTNIYLPDRLWQVHLKNCSPNFAHYWTLSQTYRAQVEIACSGTSSSMKNLGQDQFKCFWISLPPEDEQHHIAEFLDDETAKIEALIGEQEKLLALLAEKRQATISHAVTRGLNPDAPMKDSGVPWLGEVPAQWAVGTIRRHLEKKISNGIFKKKDDFGKGTLLINVFDIYRDDYLVNYSALDRVVCTNDEIQTYQVQKHDLFFVRSSLKREGIAAVATAEKCAEEAVFECHLIQVRLDRDVVSGRFASFLFNSAQYRAEMSRSAKVTTMTTIDQEAILSMPVLLPPLAEQALIVESLERHLRMLDTLRDEILGTSTLLKERRSALIAAAVTGKIDVRGLMEAQAA